MSPWKFALNKKGEDKVQEPVLLEKERKNRAPEWHLPMIRIE